MSLLSQEIKGKREFLAGLNVWHSGLDGLCTLFNLVQDSRTPMGDAAACGTLHGVSLL